MQLPPVIETILLNVITPECYQSLIVEHHVFSDIACVQMVISKVLGYAIILGSVILKLPQILKICAAKDVTGLSLTSFYLDVLIFESNTVYNYLMGYPISTWGENIVILIQNLVLVLLIWSYTSTHVVSSITRVSFTLIFVLIGQAMLYIPHEYRWMLIVSGIPLSVAARVPQIVQNAQQQHTGQLALVTLVLNFVGSLARFFTTIQETGDVIQLYGYAISVSLNGILVAQVLWYWSYTTAQLLLQKKKKK